MIEERKYNLWEYENARKIDDVFSFNHTPFVCFFVVQELIWTENKIN